MNAGYAQFVDRTFSIKRWVSIHRFWWIGVLPNIWSRNGQYRIVSLEKQRLSKWKTHHCYITDELFRRTADRRTLEHQLLRLYKRKTEALLTKLDNVVDLIEEGDADATEKVLLRGCFTDKEEHKTLGESMCKTINLSNSVTTVYVPIPQDI